MTDGKRKQRRITVACTTCRTQHLRCDGTVPRCTRCEEAGRHCVYKDIRRQGPRHPAPLDLPLSLPAPPRQSPVGSLDTFTDSSAIREVDAFYNGFFPGHPFVLPRGRFFSHPAAAVANLTLAMRLIGSRYLAEEMSSATHRNALELAVANGLPQSAFSVQTLLLYALSLEFCGEQDLSQNVLDDAKSMALAIGMHMQSFATRHSEGCQVLAECWRRTWWDLYVVDGTFAGIRHLPTFSLWHVDANVGLPCEELDYVQMVSRRCMFDCANV